MLRHMKPLTPREWTSREAGKVGGHARAKSLTKARRKEIAANAAKARWAKARKRVA